MKSGLWPFIAGIIIVAYIGIRPSKFVEIDTGSLDSSLPTIANIVEVRGQGLSKAPGEDFYHQASSGQKLLPLHQLLTGFDSQLLVDIGERFWLMPNSQIRLQKDGAINKVFLLSGSLKRLAKPKESSEQKKTKEPQTTEFYVAGVQSKDLLVEKAKTLHLTHLPLEGISLETNVATAGTTSSGLKVDSINEKQIHQTFRLHQRFIEKCFIKHYSKTSGQTQTGKVWIRFTINSKGQLNSPRVSRSDYKDEEFHSCLKDVVQRVQIKGYSGRTMQVEFPIEIQLPQ